MQNELLNPAYGLSGAGFVFYLNTANQIFQINYVIYIKGYFKTFDLYMNE